MQILKLHVFEKVANRIIKSQIYIFKNCKLPGTWLYCGDDEIIGNHG
jgi:hypothetical protein